MEFPPGHRDGSRFFGLSGDLGLRARDPNDRTLPDGKLLDNSYGKIC
jgi:hypothetical protein